MRGLLHQHPYIDYGARAFSQHRRNIQQITSANHHRTNTWLNSQILRKSKESRHPQTLVAKTGEPITTWRMDIYIYIDMLTVAFYCRNRRRRDLPPPPLHSWSRNHPHEAPPAADAAAAPLRSWRRPPPSPPPPASQIRWDGIRRFSVASFARSSLYLVCTLPENGCN